MKTTAGDIMTTNVYTIRTTTTVGEAVKLLINFRITGLPVINKKGKIVGIFSEYDVLRQISQEEDLTPEVFKKKVVFSKKVDSILATESLDVVIERFIHSKFRRLPVVDKKGELQGIITRRDLMRVFYYRAALG
ncbi:MAG: HPP family protein [Bdellovibrionia bacterium]